MDNVMNQNNVNIQDLEARIEEIFSQWNVPGVAVGIIRDGELVSARGYGVRDVNNPLPVDADTNFAIGSNTKAFTAACIGMLVGEGKMDWDDPVTRYLPDFAVYDPWITQHVTVRDILSHRIGVSDVERFLYNTTISNAEVIRRYRYVQPNTPFRYDMQYSNIAFMAAGEILHAVTGQSWETLVQERIFKPLGMQRSTTNFNDVQTMQNIALPHVNKYSGLLSMRARLLDPVDSIPWYDFGSQSAGGITSNVNDMAKWLGCFLGKGVYQGNTVLQPKTVEMMTRPTNIMLNPFGTAASLAALGPEINFWTYGLGWFIVDYKGHKMVMHGGQVQGMISVCGFLPQEQLGYVVLTNINLSMIQINLAFTILDALLGGGTRDWTGDCFKLVKALRGQEEEQARQLEAARKRESQPSQDLEHFTGLYDHDYFGEHKVILENGRLMLWFAPQNIGDLEHWQEDTFVIHWRNDPFDGDFLTFNSTHGRVDGFTIHKEGFFKRIS